MKKLLLLSLLIPTSLLRASIAAEDLEIADIGTQPLVKKYGAQNPDGTIYTVGFALTNQSKNPVWITLVNGSRIILNGQKVAADSLATFKDSISASIDINKDTTLALWTAKPENPSVTFGWLGLGKPTIKANIEPRIYSFASGTTLYLTLNKDGQLGATQPLKGGNVSRTGFDLSKNVSNTSLGNPQGEGKSCPVK